MFDKLRIPFAATLLVLWLGLGSWWYGANYCGVHGESLGGVPGLSLIDGNYEITAEETFAFYKSSADPSIPVATEEAFQALADYLKEEPTRQLTLFGIYSPNESNGTGFENLGQARASAIRDVLMDYGVPKKKLKVKGGSFGNASFANGLMYGGVYFRFQNVNESPNTPIVGEERRSNDLFQPVNIYFDVNEYDLILTDDLEAYLEDIKSFLQKNSNAQVTITGHTDNRGSGDANLSLSETRARNVKKFMIRSGFSPKRLVIEYRGEEEPLNPNKTEESMKKNRRVELRLRTK